MKILAISGSGRTASTNTALLNAVAQIALPNHSVTVFSDVSTLPVFSPDLEKLPLPQNVRKFVTLMADCDGVIISSPEYVRSIPGGLKNAIDWLVSRDEIISKPIALMHASHRGDDMLAQLRLVLSTVSQQFTENPFARFDLMKLSPEEISDLLRSPGSVRKVTNYLREFALSVKRDSQL